MNSEEVAIKIAEHDEQIKVCNHRIADLEATNKRIESLTLSVQKLALSVEKMAAEQIDYRKKQNELASRLLNIEQAPMKEKAKKHDEFVGQLIQSLISGVVGFLLAYIGLSL